MSPNPSLNSSVAKCKRFYGWLIKPPERLEGWQILAIWGVPINPEISTGNKNEKFAKNPRPIKSDKESTPDSNGPTASSSFSEGES
ncbi:hypothetical protein CVT26_002725 [Gymnopilus dilepis]|uniref:Uncharacterized protein n=1 Tax=Gymnopilus dilepis TaxID=231916 RepID=A0A409Y375_9AGAR|nr:hypothetical protein CVT26_002725 [Gymnopilus dilepis]